MKTKKFALGLLSGRNMHGSDSLKLKLVKVKKSTNKLCFSVSAAIHWNYLPFNVSSMHLLTVFTLLLPILYLAYYLNFQFDLLALHGPWQTSMLIVLCSRIKPKLL